jgi:hypothetical protein
MRFTPTLRFFRRDAAVRGKPDPADLGTAFGMEASLEASPDDYRTSQSYALESQTRQTSQDSPLDWLNRRTA